jgi:hypothetical protein
MINVQCCYLKLLRWRRQHRCSYQHSQKPTQCIKQCIWAVLLSWGLYVQVEHAAGYAAGRCCSMHNWDSRRALAVALWWPHDHMVCRSKLAMHISNSRSLTKLKYQITDQAKVRASAAAGPRCWLACLLLLRRSQQHLCWRHSTSMVSNRL